MAEEWRSIPGYAGLYEVSNLGRVRSLDRLVQRKDGTKQKCRGRILKIGNVGAGYAGVGLHQLGVSTTRSVHSLVLQAFAGPRPEGMAHTRHLNGDRRDNRLENLVYGTPAENAADKHLHGTFRTRPYVATECARGHTYTPENTGRIGDGHRFCRTCRRANDREAKRRLRNEGIPADDHRHGTVSGYLNFRCRCQPCKAAYGTYRLQRKSA